MRNISLTVAFLVLICSCSDQKAELFKEVNFNLTKAIENATVQNEYLYNYFENQSSTTKLGYEKVREYYPKVIKLRKFSESAINYLESKKSKVESNNQNNDTSPDILLDRIKIYKDSVLSIDSQMANHLKNTLPINVSLNRSDFYKSFDFIDKDRSNIMISILQNEVKLCESYILQYFHSNSIFIGCGFGSGPKLIVNQSSTVLKVGDSIYITAGIGTFSSEFKSEIFINNKKVSNDFEGFAKLAIITSRKFGKHKIPVKVKYLDENGYETTREEIVTYEVVH